MATDAEKALEEAMGLPEPVDVTFVRNRLKSKQKITIEEWYLMGGTVDMRIDHGIRVRVSMFGRDEEALCLRHDGALPPIQQAIEVAIQRWRQSDGPGE